MSGDGDSSADTNSGQFEGPITVMADQGEPSPHNAEDGACGDDASQERIDNKGQSRLRQLFRKLSVNDWLTFIVAFATLIVGIGSLVVSYWTFRISSDSTDIKNAIGRLADLAKQTKRQADTQSAQLSLLRDQRVAVFRQADAAADSAKAAKDTAATAKGQTAAIVEQAKSLIQGAQATIKAANAELASAQANIRTAEAGLKAAEEQRRSAELFSSTRAPASRLSSVEITGWSNLPDKDGMIMLVMKPNYTNTGGGTLFPLETSFNVILSSSLPIIAPTEGQRSFGGNENPISPNGFYYPLKPFEVRVRKSDIDAVNAGKTGIIVWGVTRFTDNARKPYSSCYLGIVSPPTADVPQGAVREAFAEGYCEHP